MSRFLINIGKQTSERFGHPTYALSDSRIMSEIRNAGFHAAVYAVKAGDVEDTAIVVLNDENPLSRYSVRHRIGSLASSLHQDCIAIVPLDRQDKPIIDKGQLLGLYHAEWGGFDINQFQFLPRA